MSMKDDIYELLREPMTDSEIAAKLKAKVPSVRRARQELVAADKVAVKDLQGKTIRWIRTGGEKVAADTETTGPSPTPDKPAGWTPGSETDKEARRAEIEERAKQLQGGPRLL